MQKTVYKIVVTYKSGRTEALDAKNDKAAREMLKDLKAAQETGAILTYKQMTIAAYKASKIK